MRLINTRTLQFEEFFENSIPAYAILSHTWTSDEVSYEEYLAKTNLNSDGFRKIRQTCKQALSRGLLYAWVDTCCINKTSSAELTEAINSMFKWYEKSTVCLAYLADVPAGYDGSDNWLAFKASKWFTRGWTLQELLAPHSLKFYASDWTQIANRDELAGHIQDVTGIDIQFLVGDSIASIDSGKFYTRGSLLARASIAERMSWAATRQTTRPEDTSYCLLGIFGVNIPLVYGEGSNAFLRLQEEILRRSFDPTILAWNMLEGDRPVPFQSLKPFNVWLVALRAFNQIEHPWWALPYDQTIYHGSTMPLLAPSPRNFKNCHDIIAHDVPIDWSLTSKGLQITLPRSADPDPYIIVPCRLREEPWKLLALPLRQQKSGSLMRTKGPIRLINHSTWWQWLHSSMLFAIATGSSVEDDNNTTRRALIIKDETKLCRILQLYSDFERTAVQKSGQARAIMIPPSQELARLARMLPEPPGSMLIMEAEDTKETFAIGFNRWFSDTTLDSNNFLGGSGKRIVDHVVLSSWFAKPILPSSVEHVFQQMCQANPIVQSLKLQNRYLHVNISEERILNEVVFIVNIRELSLRWVETQTYAEEFICMCFFLVIKHAGILRLIAITVMLCPYIAGIIWLLLAIYSWYTDNDYANVTPSGASGVTRFSSIETQRGLKLLLRSLQSTWLIITTGRLGFYLIPVLSCFLPPFTPFLRRHRLILGMTAGMSMYTLDLLTFQITLKVENSCLILGFVLAIIQVIIDTPRLGREKQAIYRESSRLATQFNAIMWGGVLLLYISIQWSGDV